jgi:mitochondrial pyruvate carrier 1
MASQNFIRYVGYLGAAANWTIPIAGMANVWNQKCDKINPQMNAILMLYSSVFFRWAIAVSPPNYPLWACHVANMSAQLLTLGKWGIHKYVCKDLVCVKQRLGWGELALKSTPPV